MKENIITGDDIDLYDFPVPRWHRRDGGRYINTMQGTVTRDLGRAGRLPLCVPAAAEIVIEGWISPDPATFEMKGPFGEYTGYFGGEQGPKHKARITAITHRNDPIFRGTLEGTLPKMLNENSIMSSVDNICGPD